MLLNKISSFVHGEVSLGAKLSQSATPSACELKFLNTKSISKNRLGKMFAATGRITIFPELER